MDGIVILAIQLHTNSQIQQIIQGIKALCETIMDGNSHIGYSIAY